MDPIQYLIDSDVAQFILTGSSARKLRQGKNANWLPGPVVALHMDPLCLHELPESWRDLNKLLFFDLVVCRLFAKEGLRLSPKSLGNIFEQWVGMELLRHLRLFTTHYDLMYWRDHSGPVVDYVIDTHDAYIPVEVKWGISPKLQDARHLLMFLEEYECPGKGYIVCRTPRPLLLAPNIMAIPWQDVGNMVGFHEER